jgi:hypothetical protein
MPRDGNKVFIQTTPADSHHAAPAVGQSCTTSLEADASALYAGIQKAASAIKRALEKPPPKPFSIKALGVRKMGKFTTKPKLSR